MMKGAGRRKDNNERPWLKRGISVRDIERFKEKQAEKQAEKLKEDAIPANAVGPGAIAGLGTGPYPHSEPGVPKKRLKVILNNAKILTRKKP
jgi:hypothetical protein